MQKLSSRLTRFATVTAFVCMLLPAFAEGGGVGGGNLPPPPPPPQFAPIIGQTQAAPAMPFAVCK